MKAKRICKGKDCKKEIYRQNKTGFCKSCYDLSIAPKQNLCKECGDNITGRGTTGLCKPCALRGENNPNYKEIKKVRLCKVCGAEITTGSKAGFCRKCAAIHRKNKPKKPKKQYICKICGKEITKYSVTGLCKKCAIRERWKNFIKKEYYCKICSKPLSKKGSTGLCQVCFLKKENHPMTGGNPSEETRRKQSLSHGGTGIPYENSKYPAKFSPRLKKQIRQRDKFQCQVENCGITEKEHLEKYKKVLHIHHIDDNKQNCSEYNLISVCTACNNKARSNKLYWQKYFKEKINGNIK